MTAVKQIEASARAQVGKGAARAVRRQGQTPAVIYGGGAAPEAIALDANKTRQLIFGGHFLTTIFEISVARVTCIPRRSRPRSSGSGCCASPRPGRRQLWPTGASRTQPESFRQNLRAKPDLRSWRFSPMSTPAFG